MSVEVDYIQWGQQSLAPNSDSWWWYTWIFDPSHWERMMASPNNNVASIQMVEEWWEKDTWGTTKCWVHWRNPGTTTVYFSPRTIVTPSRY